MNDSSKGRDSRAAIDISPEEFRAIGHRLVDDVAALLDSFGSRPVAPGRKPSEVRALLGSASIPEQGSDPGRLVADATKLLADNSTFNGHPRFFGYITASAAPIGILSEMLAAAINPNCGGWALSPTASEIELQTIRWMAELTGFPVDCGGIFVSGGNMANIVCFLCSRKRGAETAEAQSTETQRKRLRCYGSVETHTWIEKAVDIAGLGADAFHKLAIDSDGRVSAAELRAAIQADKRAGVIPFLVIATAGSTNIGAIDPIADIADVCRNEGVWLHVDGAYGAPVAALPDASPDLRAVGRADSLAIDPHKWLYAPLEAGCALVRKKEDLLATFSHTPHYYHFDEVEGEEGTNFYELGPQNSRGFRALKVWLAMKQVGRAGYVEMMSQDIALTRRMFEAARAQELLETFTCELSIATFRFVPADLRAAAGDHTEYINKLNEELLSAIQEEGEVFLSNALVDGKFLLRACIVNFRTKTEDVTAVPEIVVRTGKRIDSGLRAAQRT